MEFGKLSSFRWHNVQHSFAADFFLFINRSKFFVFRKTLAQSLGYSSKLVSTIRVKKRKQCNYK